MPYSFWKDARGYDSVSVNKELPGPVAGYLMPSGDGWVIEGDEPPVTYRSREEAAQILIDRYHEISN